MSDKILDLTQRPLSLKTIRVLKATTILKYRSLDKITNLSGESHDYAAKVLRRAEAIGAVAVKRFYGQSNQQIQYLRKPFYLWKYVDSCETPIAGSKLNVPGRGEVRWSSHAPGMFTEALQKHYKLPSGTVVAIVRVFSIRFHRPLPGWSYRNFIRAYALMEEHHTKPFREISNAIKAS